MKTLIYLRRLEINQQKVTIAEGRRHIATFPDEPESEYNLESAEDLSRLRNDIERKMIANCVGKTISSGVISINIKGPGLKRMILVDLPGLSLFHY